MAVDEDVAESHEAMREVRVAPTADRSVVGATGMFTFMVGHRRD